MSEIEIKAKIFDILSEQAQLQNRISQLDQEKSELLKKLEEFRKENKG